MLALVQGQWGWANMTKVELVRASAIALLAGQCAGTLSCGPGMFEYLVIHITPAETEKNQSAKAANATLRPLEPVFL